MNLKKIHSLLLVASNTRLLYITRDSIFSSMGLIMMLLLSTLIACQVMDNPGHVFSSVAIAQETNET